MKKILVVDDDKAILEMLEDILTLNHFEVLTMTNGKEMTRTLKTYKPDLLLLDVMLGNEDGREICRSLKGNITTKSLPVILMSAFDGNRTGDDEGGPDSFIAKPFDIHSLVKEIDKLATTDRLMTE